jgi:hypothetical protein
MGRIVVEDPWGTSWTVRTRSDRHIPLDAEGARRRREPELRARLGAVLAPTPQVVPTVVHGPFPGTRGSPEDRHSAGLLALLIGPDGGLIALLVAIGRGLSAMRADYSRAAPVVELRDRGRFRRGATWRVAGPDAGVRALATGAEAVRAGRVPQLDDALLLDVVDQRLTVYGAPR